MHFLGEPNTSTINTESDLGVFKDGFSFGGLPDFDAPTGAELDELIRNNKDKVDEINKNKGENEITIHTELPDKKDTDSNTDKQQSPQNKLQTASVSPGLLIGGGIVAAGIAMFFFQQN